MDLQLSRSIEESFRIFQGRILAEYDSMIEEMGFHVIDASGSIESQQQQMRDIVLRKLGDSLRDVVLRTHEGEGRSAATSAAVL
jgi:dTMP kinase